MPSLYRAASARQIRVDAATIRRKPVRTVSIPERSSSRSVDWHGVTVMGSTMPPPRTPDEDDEDEDEDAEPDDLDQAVVREPDE